METPDVTSELIGNWGRWQLRTVILIYLCKIPSAWFMACIIFTAPTPRYGEFFCSTSEEMDQFNTSYWINKSSIFHHEQPLKVDYCKLHDDKNGTGIPCTSFEHSSSFTSLVTQFDLVCSKTILIAVTQFFHLFGVLTGGILATKLLEVYSPRRVMVYGMITQIVCGCLTGLAVRFEVHIFFRYLSAVCCAQMYTAGQMIFTDITGGKYKTYVTSLFETFWSLGVIFLPLLAYLCPDWSNLYLIISLPTVIYIGLWFLIPDSPRWLLKYGYIREASDVIQQAVHFNKKKEIPKDLEERLCREAANIQKMPAPVGWWSIWRGPNAVPTIIALHFAWAVYVTNYNGMLLNVKAFGRDFLSINTIIFGISEIIGVFIGLLLILKTRRKWLWTGVFNIVAGILSSSGFLLPATFSETDSSIFLMFTAAFAKSATSSSQAMLFTCTAELVPPEKRRICVFSCVVWARIILLSAPFIGALIGFHQILPLASFGLLSLLGGIATATIRS